VLVADALDGMPAESGVQQRRALERLGGDHAGSRIERLEVVAGGNGARASGGRDERGEAVAVTGDSPEDALERATRDMMMPDRVPQLLELVEDHALRAGAADLPAPVVDLLDVRLAAGRRDDLGPDLLEPVEALAAHLLGQDADRVGTQQRAVEGTAATEVPGGRPDGLLRRRVEAAGHERRHEAAEARTDLVRPRREPLADDPDDPRVHAGERARELDEVAVVETTSALDGLVAPRDAEEVDGIDVPQPDLAETLVHVPRHERRVVELGEGRNDHAPFPAALRGPRSHRFVDSHGRSRAVGSGATRDRPRPAAPRRAWLRRCPSTRCR
jgi:hypothetical protein